jgi:Phosphodiester glycosidase
MRASTREDGCGSRSGYPARRLSAAGLTNLAALIGCLASCTPVKDDVRNPPAPPAPARQGPASAAVPVPGPSPAHAAAAPRVIKRECSGITFEGVSFDSRTHKLVVVDQPGGPGSVFADSASAGRSRGALAAINAGFFTPEGAPLGLVVASGKRAGSWNIASSLGSGIWHDDGNSPRITRRESLGNSAASSMRELVQAGPMLIENGRAVGGLNGEKSSIRTLILCDGGSRWWIGRASFCTLARAASTVSHDPPVPWPVRHALNLDGGRSTDLWVSSSVSGGPASWRTPFNKPVRNFLVLLPHSPSAGGS